MNIALVGYGTMGKIVHDNFEPNDKLVGIVSIGYLESLFDIKDDIDVIIDFSHPANLNMICDFVKKNHTPVVIATTGFSASQIEQIHDLANYAPVLYSSNFSLGVILLNRVIREVTPILKDKFDIEVIEKHHNKKIDAPSGTAKMLVDTIKSQGDFEVVNGRVGSSKRNPYKEIGVHAVRGGTIVGEHSVIFAGNDEVLEFKHEAHSKAIFAVGAVAGSKWLVSKPNGLYNMEDVLFN
ncbi:MAG: 4-hydroxy-tetrahydrodipicolinate reductase [Anaeroplasmataceae bacterium]